MTTLILAILGSGLGFIFGCFANNPTMGFSIGLALGLVLRFVPAEVFGVAVDLIPDGDF